MKLGERRKKQRIVPDPRNKAWFDDNSKVGSKLLMKMGWSNGKGLGAREQGFASSTELRLNPNSNNKGFGCSTEQAEAWESGSNDFDSILEKLNSSTADFTPQNSSQYQSNGTQTISKGARIRYTKTAKSKDVGLYKDNDVQSILGRRKADKISNHEKDKEVHEDAESGNNMHEYFKEKLKKLKAKQIVA